MQTALQKALQLEFQTYDVWSSRLQKARKVIAPLRKKRNASIKGFQQGSVHRKKAWEDEQALWAAETDYAHLLFYAHVEIQKAFQDALQGYQAPTGPSEMPVAIEETTSFSNSE